MKKKIIIISIIAIVVAGFVVYNFFIKEEEPEFKLEEVKTGTVVREVSETGAVKLSEKVDLSFENTGRIKEIYVKVGDKVSTGQNLAKLDTQQLYLELQEAQAALEVAKADYDKLLAGSSEEEIRVAETEVLNAQVALDNAKQNLEDVELNAEEDLDQVYEDALDTLDDAYLKIFNAYNTADNIKRTYFSASDQEGIKVQENVEKIKKAKNTAKFYLDLAKESSKTEDTASALTEVKKALSNIKEALEVIRDVAEEPGYKDTVSSSDKTSLDNHKSYINDVYSDIVSAQQTISSTKITNQTNVNNAKADVSLSETKLQKAKDELALKKAGPSQEEINFYQAKIKQAEAKVLLLENKIQKSILRSPTEGQITKVNRKEGETVASTESVISLLPSGEFQVEADIYEEDIVDVKVGDPVEISLPAFPNEILKGKVIAVDPAEKIIDGVVYYEVNISFLDTKEGIKPGMTADIVIETAKKENVLVVPKGAVQKKDGKSIVRVLEDGEIKEREIETGLEGDDSIEVISGLSKGEKIVID